MVIALFALSLAMIVGGIAAVVQGFPYVRLESGLAMVIGGTTAASAGVVLLGLGAAVMQLKRLEGFFQGNRFQGHRSDAHDPREEAPPLDTAFRAPAVESVPPFPTVPRPRLAGAAGLAGVALGAAAADGLHESAGDRQRTSTEQSVAQEPLLPDLLPPEDPAQAGPDEDLFAHPEDRPGHPSSPVAGPADTADAAGDDAQRELALRPALDEPAAGAGPRADEAPAPAAAKPERHAVGSYASGGNTYVMFSDGTIDAETLRGRFSFQSLDELKDFVASGEADERGAA